MSGRYRRLIAGLGVASLFVLAIAQADDPAAMAIASAALAPAAWVLSLGSVALIFIAAGTPGRARAIVARALVPLMVASFIALGLNYNDVHERNGMVVAAADRLIRALDPLPTDADIYSVGAPYPAGRTFELRQEDGTTSSFTTASATWFFMIDLAPDALRGHPIRYAFLDDSGARWEDAEWFALVDGAPSWTLTGVTAVRGYDVGIIAPAQASTAAGWSDPLAGIGETLGHGSVASAADGEKKAIVVDGGDKWIHTPIGMPLHLVTKLKQIEARIEMRKAADDLQRQLADRGYDVTRFAAGFAKTGAAPPPTRDAIVKAVQDGVAGLKSGQELYLHVIAHGGVGGVALYTEGNGPSAFTRDVLGYADLAKTLKDAIAANKAFGPDGDRPPHIVVAIDACRSASARDVLGDIPGVSLHTATRQPDELTRAGVNEGDPTDRRMYTRSMLKALAGPYGSKDVKTALRAADDARAETTLRRAEAIVLSGASPSPSPAVRASPTPRPAATFTVATVAEEIRAKWRADNYATTAIACDRDGIVQAPATVTCSYLTPKPAIGGVRIILNADGSYGWDDAPGFFDMNYVITMLKQQWSGSQLASISCDKAAFVQGPAQVGCSFADNLATGTVAITLNGDGSWRWSSSYAQAAVVTPAPARVTAAPAAACDNPYANTSWSGLLDLDFYGAATYRTTITFTFGSATSGDCESVRVASAQVSDGSRTWRLDTVSGIGCLYHRAAPVGTGAYARCETVELVLKLRLVSGAPGVGITSGRPEGYAINPLSVSIRNSGSSVLTPTRISGPGGAGCCQWGTFSATRR